MTIIRCIFVLFLCVEEAEGNSNFDLGDISLFGQVSDHDVMVIIK